MNTLQINIENLDSIIKNIEDLKNQNIGCVEINLFDFIAIPFPEYFPDDIVSEHFEIERREIGLNTERYSISGLKKLCDSLHSMNIKVLFRIINNEYLGNELYSYMQRVLITYNNRNVLTKTSVNNDAEYEYRRRLADCSIFKTIDVECSNYMSSDGKTLKEQATEWFNTANGDKESLNQIFLKHKKSIFEEEHFEELKQNLVCLISRYNIDGFIFADDKNQNQSILCEELKAFIKENSLLGYQEVRKSLLEVTYIPLYNLPKGYIRLEEEEAQKAKVFCLKIQ